MTDDLVTHRSTVRQGALACAWLAYLTAFCAATIWVAALAGAALGSLPLICTAAVVAFVLAGLGLLAVDALRRREPRFGGFVAPVAPPTSL